MIGQALFRGGAYQKESDRPTVHGVQQRMAPEMKMTKLCAVLFLFGLQATAAIIKTGDVLDIVVREYPQFSGRYSVRENGTIDYPLLADETVVNISTSELMNHLTFRLARHVDNPLVLVTIVEKPEISVTVLGEVVTPGPVTAYSGVTLQEALALAGGPTARADLSNVKILAEDMPDANAVRYDLNGFMQDGNMDEMPRLEEGDMVVLLSRERTDKVKVIGGVRNPGFFELEGNLNLFEIIYMAGGPAEKADLSRVRRFFRHEGKSVEETIDVQAYIDKGRMDEIPLVEEGDVIIVYTKWFDWKTLMTILNNTLLFIVTLQAFANIFDK